MTLLHQLIEWISNNAIGLITSYGVLGIFIGMLLESACIPIPSEVIMLFGGFFIQEGAFNYFEVVSAGVLGNLVGSILIYWVGATGARTLIEKYGKYVWIQAEHIKKAEHWFNRYGEYAAFFGRNLPIIRTFISLPAGIAKMNFSRFVLFTFLGCLPWNLVLTYLGYKLGENWNRVEPYIRPFSYGIALILVVLLCRHVYKLVRNHKRNFGTGQ
ncbi:DedA family protein [Paenibacillus sp. MAH-36]|uniref:DedA family protein n=1 Tax=Paenibacillus violae TaxID=3077234 RepID=A0ABU3RP37_9BACL|nr:DedA family protein [Paenibacillus sp. PFR10]MDU0206057.1 DedA family protein [Paenibacillus sp. PFR10]